MDNSAFMNALESCRKPVDEASSLPADCYRSKQVLAMEIDRLFHRNWVGLGRADRLPRPGDYEAIDIGSVPLILVRDGDGTLNALHNACRHRATRLLEGVGQCRGIRCPFHSWHYNLKGKLVSAPGMEVCSGFHREQFGLTRFPLRIHEGFLFVSLGQHITDLDQQLGDFDHHHRHWNLASLVSTRRRRFEVRCNWKLFLDVFNEYYHLPTVHPRSIGGLYQQPDPGETVSGAYATQFGCTAGTGGLLQQHQQHGLPVATGLTGRMASGTRYTWLFPNMTFAAGSDAFWSYETFPVDPDNCAVYQTVCFPAESVTLADFEARAAFYYARLDAAIEEDIVVLERQQRGMRSPHTQPGRYASGLEPSVAAFSRWYAEQLGNP